MKRTVLGLDEVQVREPVGLEFEWQEQRWCVSGALLAPSCARRIMDLFERKLYRIRCDAHRVYVKWLRPIEQWPRDANDEYLAALREAVKSTVDSATWTLISQDNPAADMQYQQYVERVRAMLIDEYELQDVSQEVKIGLYHLGFLVLDFPAKDRAEYPYYYRGVQLKPLSEAQHQAEPDSG